MISFTDLQTKGKVTGGLLGPARPIEKELASRGRERERERVNSHLFLPLSAGQ